MKLRILFIMAIVLGTAVRAIAALTVDADSAYTQERYTEAVRLYNEALKENGRNADIYYNLGNANYRAGHVAQAVLAYERALRVNPAHADARANLDFVNSRLEDKPEDNNSLLTRAHEGVVRAMSANGWAWTAFVTFVLLCGAAALYIFSSNVTVRKAGFFGGMILVVLTIYFIVVAADASARVDDHSEAIVTAPSTLLNSVPRQPKQTEKVVPLHEGTKVEIIDSVSTPDDPVSPRWYNVRINGSTGAWLRATDVERI
ncbi:MAG: tetratricopeptide repeat protein [Muribaculaceae bacterium]|nr:tetratricopeptide repeat protein [Muribaculaceae bacterium]